MRVCLRFGRWERFPLCYPQFTALQVWRRIPWWMRDIMQTPEIRWSHVSLFLEETESPHNLLLHLHLLNLLTSTPPPPYSFGWCRIESILLLPSISPPYPDPLIQNRGCSSPPLHFRTLPWPPDTEFKMFFSSPLFSHFILTSWYRTKDVLLLPSVSPPQPLLLVNNWENSSPLHFPT